ncbi:MAG: translation elongation factor Ts [Coriobacteriia bacterium]|nr:translation elongation factor Ts [Coriobacteriia bacterium]MCL2537151.1 translation elongation factor Ts [Coriobacteriia bacterium]
MAEITAKLVKELREKTGAGMMECKKALTEVEGDIEKAIDYLRTQGLAAHAKKAGRATNEGAIAEYISVDDKTGALIEVNCETDFVAMNQNFTDFVKLLAEVVVKDNPADVDALKTLKVPNRDITVEELFGEAVGKLGENIQVARFTRVEIESTGALAAYIHGGAKIGIMVQFALGNQATAENEVFKIYARDVAMQVAAASPMAVRRDDFDADVINREKEIYKTQAAESGKPEAIQEKMAEGRLNKFFKEQALVEQAYVKDMDISIEQYTARVAKEIGDSIEIVAFTRYDLGSTAA